MILRLTVHDTDFRKSENIEVDASPDSPVAALLDSLPVEAGGRACFVGASRLDPEARLADSPLLPGAVLSVGRPGPDYQPVRSEAAGTLHVVAGPDAGFGVALQPGSYSVGRSPESPLFLQDTDVSRRHALLDVAANGTATITDLGSSNGTFLNGDRLAEPKEITNGAILRMGRDQFRWAPATARELRVTRTPEGQLEFNRSFAGKPTVPNGVVELPPSKEPPPKNFAMMALSGFFGLAAGVVMAVLGHQLAYMAFSLSGIVMPFAQYGVERHQEKKQLAELSDSRTLAQDRVTAQAEETRQAVTRLAPGPGEIVQMATGARADLWPRDAWSDDGLLVRVGMADQLPPFEVRGDRWEGFVAPVLRSLPVILNLREAGVLGVVGSGDPPRSLMRWILAQIATLCSPDDLRIVVLISDHAQHGAWSMWLPHLNPGSIQPMPCWIGNTPDSRAARIEELTNLIVSRRDRRPDSPEPAGPAVVVVLDGALALRNLPGIRNILNNGPSAGVYSICLDTQAATECRSVCEVTPEAVTITPVPGGLLGPVTPEFMDNGGAEEIARALAPMRDRAAGDAQSAIPYPVRLLDVMGIGEPRAADVLGLWRAKKPGPNARVILGADASGPAYVDLADQGPHTMLGGATGAGKSILLQTLVTALLLANRPDELNLVLVDFKGGSAFLPFEHCPHVTALIRSTGETPADTFDEADAARVLASVRAEVSRRESILARYGGELEVYWRTRASDPDLDPLPRLVMVFDEFARVLDISPDFLRELVNVAGKGRSLGMHLVLATQSLQGKLNDELKNNISLRISLRQNEAADSSEVLGAPDAASIPGALRGRGMYLWTGDPSRTAHPFQSGYLGDPPPKAGQTQSSVRTLRWTDLGVPRPAAASAGEGATDQELTVAAIEEAAASLHLPAPFRALLPGLPARVPLERLPEYQTKESPGTAIPFGLTDEPDLQSQPACYLDLASADHLMVAGGPQSGRTTFARALVTGVATRFRADQAHLYIVESQPAGLADYADLPHCGGVFSPAEPDRIRRLVSWLETETRRRLAARFAPGGDDDPSIVVIIDGWEHFENRSDTDLMDVSLGPTLRGIIETGAPVGVHIVPVGGQDTLNGKVAALCNRRLLLAFPNEDTRRMNLSVKMTSPPALPGRAIDAGNGRHVQLCEPDETAAELVSKATAAHEETAEVHSSHLPRQFPSLPARIEVAELPLPEPLPSPSWIPLGIGGRGPGGADLATIGTDPFEADPHLMLIAGPSGSGRTSAIATLARTLDQRDIGVLAIAPPQSPLKNMLADEEDIQVLSGLTIADTVLREAAELFGDDRYAVLLDDAERITIRATVENYSEEPTLLEDISQPDAFGRRALIMAAEPEPLLSGQRRSLARVTNEIMTTGTRVLLTPAKRYDAVQLDIPLEPDQYFTSPPGRGYLASGGAPTLVQLANDFQAD